MRYEEDLESEFKELFLHIRKIILDLDENIKEVKNKKQTSYRFHCRCICTLKTTDNGIYLTIGQGAKVQKRFLNKYNILKGDGKIVRHITYSNIKEINKDEFIDILEEVIAINFEISAC